MNESTDFWDNYYIPVQAEDVSVEPINPADAYRRQVQAINASGPLYAELEVIESRLSRLLAFEKGLARQVLAQNMDSLKGTQTRTGDLVDAFVLAAGETFEHGGLLKDVRPKLLKARQRIEAMERRKLVIEKRLKALDKLVDVCENVLNWAKHEARLELTGIYGRQS
jgi:hypothetical protein